MDYSAQIKFEGSGVVTNAENAVMIVDDMTGSSMKCISFLGTYIK